MEHLLTLWYTVINSNYQNPNTLTAKSAKNFRKVRKEEFANLQISELANEEVANQKPYLYLVKSGNETILYCNDIQQIKFLKRFNPVKISKNLF